MLNKWIIYCCCLLFFSCGYEPEEERANAVLSANIELSSGNCNEAISALNEAPFSWKDPTFLRTFSLAYACKGKFDVLTLFSDDLPLFGSVNDSILGGLTKFSTSDDMSSPTDSDYKSMETALNYLLYAGGIDRDENPTPTLRESLLGSTESQEIEMLAFYEILVNLGRFLHYYGNADSDGAKGAGGQSNVCFLDYDDVVSDAPPFSLEEYFDTGATGSCTKLRYSNSGHEYLNDTDGEPDVEKLCEGVVLINNFFKIFPSVLANISGADFDDFDGVEDVFDNAVDLADAFKSGTSNRLKGVTSYDLCVSNNQNDDSYIQVFYAFIFEVLFP